RGHRVLDAGAAGVVDGDHRAGVAVGEVHGIGDLAAEHLADRAAVHGLVVGDDHHGPAVDGAPAGDHAVAVHGIAAAGLAHQFAEFDEAALVDEHAHALAGAGDLLRLALGDARFARRFLGEFQDLQELIQLVPRTAHVLYSSFELAVAPGPTGSRTGARRSTLSVMRRFAHPG